MITARVHSTSTSINHINVVEDTQGYAYRQNQSKTDGISIIIHQDLTHTENKDTYVRLWLLDFCSTFIPLLHRNWHPSRVNGEPPQCVGSWASKNTNGTVVNGLIIHRDETVYRQEVQDLKQCCGDRILILNAKKMKELAADFLKYAPTNPFLPLYINSVAVEIIC